VSATTSSEAMRSKRPRRLSSSGWSRPFHARFSFAIDAYLDSFEGHEPEDVVWLHDVAQASLEATFELQRRRAAPS
jgi:hypothetical protein